MKCSHAFLSLLLLASSIPARGQDPAKPQELVNLQNPDDRTQVSVCDASAPLSDPISVGFNVQKSKLLSSSNPVYPPGSKGAGEIVIVLTINEDGAVYSIRFLRCPESLRTPVRAAICKWRYQPTYLDIPDQFKPVPVRAIVRLSYVLGGYRF
jgi:hypothetical protein